MFWLFGITAAIFAEYKVIESINSKTTTATTTTTTMYANQTTKAPKWYNYFFSFILIEPLKTA